MKKVTLLQKMKPFVGYSVVMVIVLFLMVFLMKSDGVNFSNTAQDTKVKTLTLSASSKYTAVKMEGLENSANAKVVNSKIFTSLVAAARQHPRKRKMTDLTKSPEKNSMQTLMNTWIEGSYSPVHYHEHYSEVRQRLFRYKYLFSCCKIHRRKDKRSPAKYNVRTCVT